MKAHRRSYWKTTMAAVAGIVVAGGGAIWAVLSLSFGLLLAVPAAMAATVGLCVALGGAVALHLDAAEGRVTDRFPSGVRRRRLEPPPTGASARFRPKLPFCGPRAGDLVQVRTREEILRTLDERARVDGLPFMPEMLAYCGRRFRVFRRVDKIHDWVHRAGLRRMSDAVTLDTVRCDGSAHGGCQAGCQIIWKGAWLRPAGNQAHSQDAIDGGGMPDCAPLLEAGTRTQGTGAREGKDAYVCQATQLAQASSEMPTWNLWLDLTPLLAGNVGVTDFAVTMLHRLFSAVQQLRGGADFPAMEPSPLPAVADVPLDLKPGEWVRVRPWEEIAPTLVNNRNRGLWFDRDMLRFCGRTFQVLRRAHRIIDEGTGKMLTLRNPCIVLNGVTASGEFLHFCPQNEYIFWREIWLERAPEPPAS